MDGDEDLLGIGDAAEHHDRAALVAQQRPSGCQQQRPGCPFTVEQIWAAHVHVLKSLSADPSLADDFTLMAGEFHQPFTRRVPTPDIFLHAMAGHGCSKRPTARIRHPYPLAAVRRQAPRHRRSFKPAVYYAPPVQTLAL